MQEKKEENLWIKIQAISIGIKISTSLSDKAQQFEVNTT